MRNPRTLVRIVASTLATAGLVLGMAAASVAAPRENSVHSVQVSSSHAGSFMSALKDSGWG